MFSNSGLCLRIYFFCMLASLAGCNEGMQIAGQSQDTYLYGLRRQALGIVQQALADKNPRVRVKDIEDMQRPWQAGTQNINEYANSSNAYSTTRMKMSESGQLTH